MFKQYLQNPIANFYIKELQIQNNEERLLWIVDLLLLQPLPLGWKAFPSKNPKCLDQPYYCNECLKIQQWEHPNVEFFVKIINQIRKASESFQINSIEWLFTTSPPSIIKRIFQTLAYFQLQPRDKMNWIALLAVKVDFSKCEKQSEEFAPIVQNLEQLYEKFKQFGIQSTSNSIVPRLEHLEAKQLPANRVLVYNFNNLSAYLLDCQQFNKIMTIRLPNLVDAFDSVDSFSDFFVNHINIVIAAQKSFQNVYDDQIVEFQPPPQPPPVVEDVDKYLEIQTSLNESQNLEALPKYVLSHTQFTPLHQSVVADNISSMNKNQLIETNQKLQKVVYKKANISNKYAQQHLQNFIQICTNQSAEHKKDSKYFEEVMQLQKGFGNPVRQIFSSKIYSMQKSSDLNLLWQLVGRYSDKSTVEATLKFDQKQANHYLQDARSQFSRYEKSESLYACQGVQNYSQNPIDELVFTFARSRQTTLNLILTIIICNDIVEYSVNGKRVPDESVNLQLGHAVSLADFFVGLRAQSGRYAFIVSHIDAMTRHFLSNGLQMLGRMRQRLEAELLKCGHETFLQQFTRFSFEQLENCLVSLRTLADVVFSLFQKLHHIKPELTLQSFL